MKKSSSMRKALSRTFGLKIRFLRKQREMTQDELARRTGLSVDGIRRLERGQFSPSLHTMTVLSEGLEVTLGSLIANERGESRALVRDIANFLSRRKTSQIQKAWKVLKLVLSD